MNIGGLKYTLGEVVDDYLLRTFNQRRKYHANYMRIAQDVYKALYRNILPTIIAKYVQVQSPGPKDPYPFIYVPDGMERFFGIYVTNDRHELLSVYYNERLNVFSKPPVTKSCGCTSTDLCDCLDNLQVVITPKVINGDTYYEKRWVECCSNGDVLEYLENPVQDDPVNYPDRVTVIKTYQNLGRLETKDCGCPLETEANKEIVYKKCGCYLWSTPKCCQLWYNSSGIKCTGEMKFSECQTKIYLKDVKDDNGFVVISYQGNPIFCGEEIRVHDVARRAIWFGMDYESSVFNPRVSPNEKREAERRKTKAENELFDYLNPMDVDRFFDIPKSEIAW